jgi:porin
MTFPMAAALIPISAYGGGIVVPWDGFVLSALALDPSGTPTSNDITEAFDDGATVLASGKITIKPFGLIGHQSVGAGQRAPGASREG